MYPCASGNFQNYAVYRTDKASGDYSFVPSCQATCPFHMDIQEYVDLLAQGRIMEALQIPNGGIICEDEI